MSRTPDRTRRGWSRDRFERILFGVGRWVVIVGMLLATVVPFYYMLLLSVRPIQQLLLDPADLLPSMQELTLTTYKTVLSPVSSGGQGFLVFLRNSLLVALGTVAVGLLAAIPGAYAVSRLRFRGHHGVSFLFLTVYLFPPMVLAIPLFSFLDRKSVV